MVNYITKIAAAAISFSRNKLSIGFGLKGPFLAILLIYVLMIVLPYFSSYVILLVQAFSDKPEIVDKTVDKMMKLFTLAASESTILAAAFIAGFATDSNNNGTPDSLEGNGKYSTSKTIEGKEESDTIKDNLLENKK